MSWLDIFRKKKEEKEKEKINFNEIETKLTEEIKDIELKIYNIKEEINKDIGKLIPELKDRIEIIKTANIDKRKEEERIKLIVRENLKLYVDYLDKLIIDLKNTENLEPEPYIRRISQIFNNFNKNSKMAFEKATILIGRELGEAKDKITGFLRNFHNFLEENKEIFENNKKLRELRTNLEKFRQDKKNKSEIGLSIKNLKDNYEALEKSRKDIEMKIQELKSCLEYKKLLEEKEKIEKEKHELEKKISEIKDKADLKFLAKFFHNDRKKSEIIKKYSENFSQALKEDENIEIIKLVNEAKNLDISELKEIKKRLDELGYISISDTEIKLNNLEKQEKRLSSELADIQNEITQESEKLAKFDEKNKKAENEIKDKAKTLLDIEII